MVIFMLHNILLCGEVRQNAAAVRRTVAAMPLAPWRCGDEAPASPTVML